MHQDPVCRMKVSPGNAAGKSTYRENTYHFCSQGCKRKFDQNPEQYATNVSADSAQTLANPQPGILNYPLKNNPDPKIKLDKKNEEM